VPDALSIGRVHGHRGAGGALTVRVGAGDAARWAGVREVWMRLGDAPPERFEVETEHAYRDRWVLKLAGIDDSTAAARWRGGVVSVEVDKAPELGEFEHWHADLVGMTVLVEGTAIGKVREIQPTAATDLLVVEALDGGEVLVPMHREIVVDVNEETKELTIDPPAGLLDLNRGTDRSIDDL
jgi:16S rRNA processing protein RimM